MNLNVFLLDINILLITILIQVTKSFGEIYNFGATISGLTQADPISYNRIYLLPNFATRDGYAFGFSTVVQNQGPAIVMVLRPQSNCNFSSLSVVGHVLYYPSVPPGWRENVYLESWQENGCIPVKRNDMIGLYFPTESPSISYIFGSPSTSFNKSRKCFDDGVLLSDKNETKSSLYSSVKSFEKDIRPYPFQIEVYYYTSEQSSATCEKGWSIPSNRTIVVHPSTTTPNYKGFSGVLGMPGIQGPNGTIGYTGMIGKIGEQGPKGDDGPAGFTGATGGSGAIGLSGDIGPIGLIGLIGYQGSQGDTGSKGGTGPQGEPGFSGSNYTVNLSDKISGPVPSESLKHDPYFYTDRAIWALFIWLAILTFVSIITFIILVASGSWLPKMG